MEQTVQNNYEKTEDRSQWISAAESPEGDGEESKCRHEFSLGGDGRYNDDCRISGRRQFLPRSRPSPNLILLPPPPPPLYAVVVIVIVIYGACRI